jgi:DNA-directed RNA polymerase subunit alpha
MVYIEKTTQDYGKLYVEPLERGYGDTIGNALRRLLLSSIKGCAVTAVRIDGVLHEFSTIPGIREDVIEILMNLKHIPVKAKTEKPQLKPEGCKLVAFDSDSLPKGFFDREENPGVVTAKDLQEIVHDNDFEFCGDGVLCTLEPGAKFSMEIYIEPGVGYLSAERERPSHLPVDALLTDAVFSPVKRVNYQIESARVGQSIDYERLILEVWTNGALSPEEAVREASTIARNYFGHIAGTVVATDPAAPSRPEKDDNAGKGSKSDKGKNKGNKNANKGNELETPPAVEPVVIVPEPPVKITDQPVNVLGLSRRSENCLSRNDVATVGQLLEYSHQDLLKFRNLGKQSITEIEEKLEELDLQLSTVSKLGNKDKDKNKKPEEPEAEVTVEKPEEPEKPEKTENKGKGDSVAEVKAVEATVEKVEKAEKTEKVEKPKEAKPKAEVADKPKPEKPKKAEKKSAKKLEKPKEAKDAQAKAEVADKPKPEKTEKPEEVKEAKEAKPKAEVADKPKPEKPKKAEKKSAKKPKEPKKAKEAKAEKPEEPKATADGEKDKESNNNGQEVQF